MNSYLCVCVVVFCFFVFGGGVLVYCALVDLRLRSIVIVFLNSPCQTSTFCLCLKKSMNRDRESGVKPDFMKQ